MAHRYCTLHEHMGYAGTDSEEEIDLLDWWGITQEELEKMSDDEVKDKLDKEAWDYAVEKVEAWAEPTER